MRAALAARNIYTWLDELSHWSWPTGSGSAGFEPPVPKRGGLFAEYRGGRERRRSDVEPRVAEDTRWMGSLAPADVARYEERVEAIRVGLDELDVEDIKGHVLHHHILPLSRPGTPMDLYRPGSAASLSINLMDDLTAVVTSVVVQTLPTLSRLLRLMNIWSARLLVLVQIPTLLGVLEDAEVAIQAGWKAVKASSTTPGDAQGEDGSRSALTGQEFDIMKQVLGKKVAKAGRIVDIMLDALDGREDTIPDRWIDRMDGLEAQYGEWVAVCERHIREAQWGAARRKAPGAAASELDTSTNTIVSTQVPTKSNLQETPSLSDQPGGGTARERAVSPCEVTISVSPADETLTSAPERLEEQLHDGTVIISPESSQALTQQSESVFDEFENINDSSFGASTPRDASPRSGSPPSSTRQHVDDDYTLPAFEAASGASTPAVLTSKPLKESPALHPSPNFQEPNPEVAYTAESPMPNFRSSTRSTVSFNDMPTVTEVPGFESPPGTPPDTSFFDEPEFQIDPDSPSRMSVASGDDNFQRQISEVLESIPAKIHLSSKPAPINLNPPDFILPRARHRAPDPPRSHSSMSSRAGTPSFLLAPAIAKNPRRPKRGNQDIKLYHLSRSTGEAPIKLFIRLVGENGERVMVRVGGGWADLGEYLKEYASHHGRRSKTGAADSKIEIRGDLPPLLTGFGGTGGANISRAGSSPPSRPASALDTPITPLHVRKTRRSMGEEGATRFLPKTPLAAVSRASETNTPSSEASALASANSTRSRSSSRLSWTEEDSALLGMSGPRGKHVEMSDESRAWVESVKEKVRIASGERKVSSGPGMGADPSTAAALESGRFGEIGKVGGTKRLFRKAGQ